MVFATPPLIPASISSNTRQGTASALAKTVFKASIIRDISPPEAIELIGFKSSPTLEEIKNSIRSKPLKFNSMSLHPITNFTLSIDKECN